ncbi:ketopantoate hydroxymethyltransferase [Paenibacillus sp. BIHB 4019]|uniref:Ketopantoate hydroxymethyltransferase n=1 Tax=Paenibacillus sp. BIHB 4019 TaxID=1870819 RepID=A0A1B2DIS0_9BACL|nr:ketopantoate hydroxymethyltransferase [Paenibacillus sp. BIHB 4019]ANY67589.1 ketopantoate hydroxymethyltransferase [Paenibacillus sp. BIHB 4019]
MITSTFKQEVAEFIDSKITKVVLNNGAYEITDFIMKSVSDNTLNLNYLIPQGTVDTVTRIELKNAAGTVSDNIVNLPIASDTLMIQTIFVKEE